MSDTGPDSGMAPGTDAGRPGEHSDSRPLAEDEQRLLAALEDTGPGPDEGFPEESEAAGRAADDEAPLPGDGGPPDDGLTPQFVPPEA